MVVLQKCCSTVTFEGGRNIKMQMARFQVTLPEPVYEALKRWAEARQQATATCAAVALEIAIRQAEERGEIPPPENKKEKP